MTVPTYKANICATEGCQWRESQAEIRRLREKISQLETTLDCIKRYVAAASPPAKEAAK